MRHNRITAFKVFASFVAGSCCACASARAQVADSQADFSGVQGQHGWYYGYYDGAQNPGGFQHMPLFNVFLPNFWSITANAPGGYWVCLSNIGGHPSGTRGIQDRVPAINASVRRFYFVEGGPVTVSGTLRKVIETCGNGVTGRIFVNGVEVWSQSIPGNDTTGLTYSFNYNFPPGSLIDWSINPIDGDEECDYSVFSATIQRDCPCDLNRDGLVDDSDFVQFVRDYNLLDCADPAMLPDCAADFNNDHVVDDSDFLSFIVAYNELICS